MNILTPKELEVVNIAVLAFRPRDEEVPYTSVSAVDALVLYDYFSSCVGMKASNALDVLYVALYRMMEEVEKVTMLEYLANYTTFQVDRLKTSIRRLIKFLKGLKE